MKSYFQEIIACIKQASQSEENFTAWFSAEELDYARFNRCLIRQAGTVNQQYLELDLICGQKHASASIGLSRDLKADRITINDYVNKLRQQISNSADDPYLSYNKSTENSSFIANNQFDKFDICENILNTANNLDLVGSYIGGPIYKGFANSCGQENWWQKSSFIIDTSIYHSGDKAIKQNYCDISYNPDVFKQKIAEARSGLELFNQASHNIKPGSYRVYFSPIAVYEILSMINWGGFSRKALEVKSSPLLPLFMGQKLLSPAFSLSENTAQGAGPNFQGSGFLKPDLVRIIQEGQLKNTLISPKSAQEYSLDHNGADEDEQICSLDMSPGNLEQADILANLSDGLYINNLWYLNFSDRNNGCITGMTRFFCYTVKNGKAAAPLSVMRFDDSIYRIFGGNLKALTKHRELIIDNGTYDERSTACARLPGIIVDDVKFTL